MFLMSPSSLNCYRVIVKSSIKHFVVISTVQKLSTSFQTLINTDRKTKA